MIHKIIYTIGQRFRNPSLKKQYLFLKESEKWTLEELESYQLKQLQKLLKEANLHSSYYQNKFKKYKLDLFNIKKLDDLKKIPVLEKKDLLNNVKSIHTNIKFRKIFSANTSGTSGQSLKFQRNEEADSFNRAAILRGYSWYEVEPWEKNGYFWGVDFILLERIKSKMLDFLQNRFRIFTYKEHEIKKFAFRTLKSKYIHGYSSMIYQTAVLINKLNLPKPKNLKLIKGTSEKILDSYQQEIKKAFGLKMISEYGATESGIIAFECKHGVMHINMEGVLVEEIDNEILVTNLQMSSFPIIRYKLGDYIKLAPKNKKCSCGLNHRIITEVTGRIGESIYGKKETYPSLYLYYIFKNISNKHALDLNYQVVQNKKGFLEFLIEQSINSESKQRIVEEIEKYFKEDVSYIISDKIIFEHPKKGKMKNFISNINA